jgi:acetyl-CoA acyltransferase
MAEAVIVDAVRTASGVGKPGGALSGVHAVELLGTTVRALVERTGLDPATVDDVIAGCVTQHGEQAVNVARSAWLSCGYPEQVPATTIDRQCGSSLQAAQFAAHGVLAGAYDVVVAAGVESMSRVPMHANGGPEPAETALASRYPDGLVSQGISAELVAARWKLSREELDDFATESHRRATSAQYAWAFDREIVPVAGRCGASHRVDETVRPGTDPATLARLRESFRDADAQARFPEIDWRVTPGNFSPLTDGAAAVLIMSEDAARRLGLRPRARFHAASVVGSDPVEMLTGVIRATEKVLRRAGLALSDLDAYDVNEAFASVTLAWLRELEADPARLNPRGGAIALGHPLGASGARLLTTMLNHLEDTSGRYGLVTLCERGGMANATIIERL